MPKRVLVVDDDPNILQLLKVNFELEGYEVSSAANGKEALEQVKKAKPDILVCDVMMPIMNGLEVVQHLRGDKATAKLPIVMVSAKAQATDLSAGDDAGADAYITKPFDPMDLLEVVGQLLKKKK